MEKRAVQVKLKFLIAVFFFFICALLFKSIFFQPSQITDGCEIRILMEEVSVFDTVGDGSPFLRGLGVVCGQESRGIAVKNWPSFKSGKVLYGNASFTGDAVKLRSHRMLCYALDESGGTDTGYDRLYLDLDGDFDLSNNKALSARQELPKVLSRNSSNFKQMVSFEEFKLKFDFGDFGRRSIEIMPVLRIYKEGHTQFSFIATKMLKGKLTIEGETFDALLGYSRSIGSRLDERHTTMQLIKAGKSGMRMRGGWWGSDSLNAMRLISGKYYSFSATVLGDELIARAYEGELGVFEIGIGGRSVSDANMRGSLRSSENSVAVGSHEKYENGWPKPTGSCLLPVGDYLPAYLTMRYGRLRISISENYHADGKPRSASMEKVYGIEIRKDKPFVLDFSNKPEVIFASPSKGASISVGDELSVKAVLIDPQLDIMIRGIDNTTRKKTEELKGASGETQSFTRDLSLDPKVIIKRSDG